MRAGLSVAVIIALNEYLMFGPLREAALAALLTCICDPGGPSRRRVPILLGFALTGAVVTAVYGLLRNFGPAVAIPLGVIRLFCSSFARIYGQAATRRALEALIIRALLEPGKQNQDPLEAAMVVDAALRRCAGRLATVQYDPELAARVRRETLRIWRNWIAGSMRQLAAGKTDLLPRPAGTETDALGRIARQIELMAGAMERFG